MNKKLTPLSEDDTRDSVEIARMIKTKTRFEVVVTSYGRNKNLDYEIKNQEKANNSANYCCGAIKNNTFFFQKSDVI